MNQYTNRVSLAKDNSGAEIVIQFSQNKPIFDENNHISGMDSTLVASLVMNRSTANGLLLALADILGAEKPTHDAVPATKLIEE